MTTLVDSVNLVENGEALASNRPGFGASGSGRILGCYYWVAMERGRKNKESSVCTPTEAGYSQVIKIADWARTLWLETDFIRNQLCPVVLGKLFIYLFLLPIFLSIKRGKFNFPWTVYARIFNSTSKWASLLALTVMNLPAMQETWVPSLGWEGSPGEGNSNPLQYSGLENSMDTVHGVAKSCTWLNNFHFHVAWHIIDNKWLFMIIAVWLFLWRNKKGRGDKRHCHKEGRMLMAVREHVTVYNQWVISMSEPIAQVENTGLHCFPSPFTLQISLSHELPLGPFSL